MVDGCDVDVAVLVGNGRRERRDFWRKWAPGRRRLDEGITYVVSRIGTRDMNLQHIGYGCYQSYGGAVCFESGDLRGISIGGSASVNEIPSLLTFPEEAAGL
jgi:hypothetical protein